ncbi:DNA internalization-related competence protein ComEC/Rec2 [Thermincola ferriacetica]|uniref:DNA internalization-related competence protein ComEC/Rec2 n=1 Tax=Thermincola ferriacetica TaxID=281456 RepID=A0A0L6VZT4_9FIRM|nr:MBL fold metallo-hydrolase [Thermincola ferriacetica]KNZ68658.1 DNA internalization-related competence protein ComEC/Rec2 [Thermincola ferriacetica]
MAMRKKQGPGCLALIFFFLIIGAIGSCLGGGNQTENKITTAPATQITQSVYQSAYNTTESPKDATSDVNNTGTGQQTPVVNTGGKLKVHFINVGQGDSILIQTPGGKNLLIDAGPNSAESTVESYLQAQGVKKLDVVVGTHPHEDHIGGLDGVIRSFDIGKIYLPKASHTTEAYASLLQSIKNKGLKVSTAAAGVVLDLGPGIEAKFLAPNGTGYRDLNDYSAVIELKYGKNSFLFEGDAETVSEHQMLAAGYNLDVDVLKVGHHGSRSSSSSSFLRAVTPKYAVISVGAGNSYGHPAYETVAALANAGAKIYRTDEAGTIVAVSDGTNFTIDKNASAIQPRAPNSGSGSGYVGGAGPGPRPEPQSGDYYIGNRNTHKFHLPSCSYLPNPENQVIFKTREAAISAGYVPCKKCYP